MHTSFVVLGLVVLLGVVGAKDMMRNIVFDKNTPDVFYCPIHKPTGFDKMIVKARPLKKLCEFEGEPLPDDYKSDCYQDIDETSYACKEKYRIMMRMHPPGGEDAFEGDRLARFIDVDREFYVMKVDDKKKVHLKNRLG
ncbi:uncharacterized protein LOC135140382 [Zophobas morio]|uniref:uncharacterized protein LOC135139830 n=1 Tax=Zophobas morio TaxID=2755281 RepID=UPI003082AAFB